MPEEATGEMRTDAVVILRFFRQGLRRFRDASQTVNKSHRLNLAVIDPFLCKW